MLSAARRVVSTLPLVAILAACSGPIEKPARDDRSSASTAGGPGATAGTPVGQSGQGRCSDAAATTELEPVYVQFVVDGSATMKDEGKWAAVVDSIKAVVDQVEANKDTSVGLGLIVFADEKDPAETPPYKGYGPYPSAADTSIRHVDAAQAQALRARLQTTPKGLTPTLQAMQGGYEALRSFTPAAPLQAGGRKVLVLITDGLPYSGSVPTGEADTEYQIATSIALAEQEARGPDQIATFAVGVGAFPGDPTETYNPVYVGRLAAAGGTRRTPTCNPYENKVESNVCHFQVTPGKGTAQELREQAFAAVNAIRQQITSCDFKVRPPPAGFQLDSHAISVRVTNAKGTTAVLPSAINGWSVDNAETPTTVRLNGDACQNYRSAGGKIEVVLACK